MSCMTSESIPGAGAYGRALPGFRSASSGLPTAHAAKPICRSTPDDGYRHRWVSACGLRYVVLNGTGLLSGRKTGIILSPLGVDEGIIFQTLDGQTIRGHITSLEDFSQPVSSKTFSANSTTLDNGRRRVRTVEHLMAVLSMYGITNVLIKVGEEIPNIDGSARDFCELIDEAGIESQAAVTKVAVIREKIGVGNEDLREKHLYAEPFEGFEISMRVD